MAPELELELFSKISALIVLSDDGLEKNSNFCRSTSQCTGSNKLQLKSLILETDLYSVIVGGIVLEFGSKRIRCFDVDSFLSFSRTEH